MDLQQALRQQDNTVEQYANKLAQALENTIIAKSLFDHNKPDAGWGEIRGRFGENCFNPNFTIWSKAIYNKFGDVVDKSKATKLAVEMVNKKCGREVFYTEEFKGTHVRWVN